MENYTDFRDRGTQAMGCFPWKCWICLRALIEKDLESHSCLRRDFEVNPGFGSRVQYLWETSWMAFRVFLESNSWISGRGIRDTGHTCKCTVGCWSSPLSCLQCQNPSKALGRAHDWEGSWKGPGLMQRPGYEQASLQEKKVQQSCQVFKQTILRARANYPNAQER